MDTKIVQAADSDHYAKGELEESVHRSKVY